MPPAMRRKVESAANWVVKALVSVSCTIFCAFAIGSFTWARDIHTTVTRIEARFDAAERERDTQRGQLVDIVSRLTRLEESRRLTEQFGTPRRP